MKKILLILGVINFKFCYALSPLLVTKQTFFEKLFSLPIIKTIILIILFAVMIILVKYLINLLKSK